MTRHHQDSVLGGGFFVSLKILFMDWRQKVEVFCRL